MWDAPLWVWGVGTVMSAPAWTLLPGEDGARLHEGVDFGADGGDGGGVFGVGEDAVNHVDDERHLLFLEAAGGDGGGAEADA